jgi:transcriptional regulator with XRE-family HTH domain
MKAGISQEALADLAGIHRTYVGDVERGERNISLINMMRLSAALEVRLSQVVLEMERNLG